MDPARGAVRVEGLHAAAGVFGHEDRAVGGYGDPQGSERAAPILRPEIAEMGTVPVEHADTVTFAIRHQNPALVVEGNAVRVVKLGLQAERRLTVRRHDPHLVGVRVGDRKAPVDVGGDEGGVGEDGAGGVQEGGGVAELVYGADQQRHLLQSMGWSDISPTLVSP